MAATTSCPFLYQTRTILNFSHRARQSPKAFYAECRSLKRSNHSASSSSSNNQDELASSFLKQKAQGVLIKKAEAASKSTMTAAERAAFDDIWRLFRTAPAVPPSPPPPSSPSPSSPLSPPVPSQQKASLTDDNDTNWRNLLDLVTTEQLTTPTSSSDPPDSVDVSGYAPNQDLRNTAEKVISDIAASFDKALKSKKIKPDIALWQVCEAQVFPLIKMLGFPQTSLSATTTPPTTPKSIPTTTTTTSNTTSTSPAPTTNSSISKSHPLIPPTTPPLPLLTLIYPTLLLLTLRLLAHHHPSSPYLLSLLPTIKSLGPTSYVLGTSTSFYNTLLRIRWEVYSDLKAVVDLLAEMERNGVDFNSGTLDVVRGIGRERKGVLSLLGEDGNVNRNSNRKVDGSVSGRDGIWWGRWEIQRRYARVEEWQGRVVRQLEERGGMGSDDWPTDFAHEKELKSDYVVTI